MENSQFEIHETRQLSRELDRDWEQELVVSRAGEAFLRLAGDGTDYRVMTATAGDNDLGLEACKHPDILLQAAHDLAVRKIDGFDGIERDRKGRNYVQLFQFCKMRAFQMKTSRTNSESFLKSFLTSTMA